MRTLILYGTKYGGTRLVSEQLASWFEDVTLGEVGEKASLDITGYDCVVVGSPVTAGVIRKDVKAFLRQNEEELMRRQIALFVCGLNEDGRAGYFKNNFSEQLLRAAKARAFLGGVFDPGKAGFFARTVIKTVTKSAEYVSTIDENKIRQFAQQILEV